MRVISGIARGRKLNQPKTDLIRPSKDMVKESMFNIIQFDIPGARVLDLFAGTGQLGIEALSRGAKSAVFVDKNSESIKLIKENLKICDFSDISMVYNSDAVKYLEYEENFDIIFLDPPYDSTLASEAVLKVSEFDKLTKNGIMMCETAEDCVLPELLKPYVLKKQYKYGVAKVHCFRRE